MRGLRSFSILIGFFIMMHGSVMSMDPHGQLVTGFDAAHGTVTDLVCDESEGMPFAASNLTDSAGAPAALPHADAPIFALGADTLRGWRIPAVTGDSLRAMLQVFLN